MKSSGSALQGATTGAAKPLRWKRWGLIALALPTLTACASQFDTPAPKVQTFHELMVKLKKGFDEGTLDTPEFYARELGYPLERPETLKVIEPPYTQSRRISLDSGELAGAVVYVGPSLTKDRRKLVSFRSANVIRRMPNNRCVALQDVQLVWGVVKPREPEAWGAHGPSPDSTYDYQIIGDDKERIATFFVSKADGCLRPDFGVAQYYKE